MNFVKLLIAWVLSMAVYAAVIQAWFAAKGQATSGFAAGVAEGFLGLAVLLAIPTFLFAVVVGWPAMSWLVNIRQPWLVLLVAPAVLALIMWVLTMLVLPDGWSGAGHALVGYAAVLGFVWACLALVSAPAR